MTYNANILLIPQNQCCGSEHLPSLTTGTCLLTVIKSQPSGLNLPQTWDIGFAFQRGKLGLKSGSSVTPGQTVSVGVPRTLQGMLQLKTNTASAGMADLNILKSWSISESPWKIGFFITISAKMQAMLQTSMGQA